ncbi:MAG: glycosyltransferase family 4 protein [Betaproteobacteria bacterium]|nr:glycosyltransferase family 4 protein [Betaproteobacteria bacterium]
MRILFYNVTASYIPGGLETYCWEAGRALARRGHEVAIAAGNRGRAWHNEVELVQFPFRIEQDWPNFGTRFRRLMERLSFARHSLAYLAGSGFDAVIVNKPFDFPILWQARRRGLAAQTLFRSGGTDFFAGDRLFAGAIRHWVSASRHNARQVEQRYGRSVQVIHNGVDTSVFRPRGRDAALRASFGAAPDDCLIASVGRLVGWKGLRVVLEALAGLPRHFRCLVVGTGSEEQTLKQQAGQLGIAERVHFCGRIDHAELPLVLSQCDLFVQPSIGEEAFGISVVEAMACGIPVLASNNGGLPEIVVEGETGRLLPPGEVAAWREAIEHTAGDGARLKSLGANARARAESEFTWAANAQKLEAIFTGGAACAGS